MRNARARSESRTHIYNRPHATHPSANIILFYIIFVDIIRKNNKKDKKKTKMTRIYENSFMEVKQML